MTFLGIRFFGSAEKLDHLDHFASAEAFLPKISLFTKIEADRD